MAVNRKELMSGIGAMFGEGLGTPQEKVPEPGESNRGYLTGRRRKDDPRELLTKDDERTTLVLNRNQYAVVREIARREGVTIKSLVSEMFRMGIEKYEKKHGKVELGDGKRAEDIF